MKNLILMLVVLCFFACKKKNLPEIVDITAYNWSLKSATVNPALTIGGKTSTNYMMLDGSSGCLNNNYILSFSNDGSYNFSSNGALCDLFFNKNAKWVKNGNEITLVSGPNAERIVTLNGENITDKKVRDYDNITYTITYVYTAKSK